MAAPAAGRVARSVYRAFLREARRMQAAHDELRLVPTLRFETVAKLYGRGSYVAADGAASARAAQAELFPGVRFEDVPALAGASSVSGEQVRALARTHFRLPPPGVSVDSALAHLATLNRLRAEAPQHSVTTTDEPGGVQVTVSVSTTYLPTLPIEANLSLEHWPFGYRVRVSNTGSQTVQLLGRHWVFTDARGGTVEVPRGSPGVVGHAPILEPHQCFEYFSGVQLATPRGEMAGELSMVTSGGEKRFDARVAPTRLEGPRIDAGRGATAAAAAGRQTAGGPPGGGGGGL